MASRPATFRSCRTTSVRVIPACCACVSCSARPIAAISAAVVVIRVSFIGFPFFLEVVAASMCEPVRTEGGPEFFRKKFGLLPGGEVTALVDLIEVAEVAIGAPCPGLRGSIDLVREHRD